ncbi:MULTISPECIES: DUF2304 domain-containing protein [Rothia]|jgi:hypothetical protein|uniref:DUF2304 domain-containing protein n=1 Tax=Rothia mucilaginosa TaxID=43675 RepID=A0A291DFJ7_9MICC|nr:MULTISPECIES: DUF2304 domain-containing protein [Rothia]ATF63184.1 DUF2304 domain-containing protein [Rothia mucilaginosa]MBF1671181.1 DUF2304 domain-containing protein [Rothia mucilaginosa]OFM21289.1 hypothetical protein HMPREF2710_03570 [Rothia sp. HMSC069D01]
MSANIFFLLIVVVMEVLVLAQVRNQKMKEKYAALWLIVGVIMIVLALFPKLLDSLSRLVGIETPVNLLFLLAIIMLMGISLHLTLAISKITDDMRTLAEEVAIMKALQRQPQGASRAAEREQKKH